MSRLFWILALLPFPSALAGGGQVLSPLGVPYSGTHTLRCQSRRSVLYFAQNTQFARSFYRGKASAITFLTPPAREGDYSDVGLSNMSQLDTPKLGPGLEWRSVVRSGYSWQKSALYRVVQHADGERTLNLLERCRG